MSLRMRYVPPPPYIPPPPFWSANMLKRLAREGLTGANKLAIRGRSGGDKLALEEQIYQTKIAC